MGISTTFILGSVELFGFLLVYFGALSFGISDAMNGYVRFVTSFNLERVYTMITYVVGQFAIVLGVLFF